MSEYIVDKFNLTGLSLEVPMISEAFDVITDVFGKDALTAVYKLSRTVSP